MYPYRRGQTVRIFPRVQTGTSSSNDPVWGWPEDEAYDIPSCAVAPRRVEREIESMRSMIVDGWDVYGPIDFAVDVFDRVRVTNPRTGQAELCDLISEPEPWVNPRSGRQPGTKISVRKVRG